MAIAYVQEFTIKDGDTSTTNYDAVNSALNLQEAPDGLLIHTAGFDHDAGVFRIFDVWETREQGEKFLKAGSTNRSSRHRRPARALVIYACSLILSGAVLLTSAHALPAFHETQWYAGLAFACLYLTLLIGPVRT